MIKKAIIENTLMDVIDYDEYNRAPSIYEPGYCAIEKDGMLYPLRKASDDRNGFYPRDIIAFYKDPDKKDIDDYSVEKNLIDFEKPENIREVIETFNKLHDAESTLLTNKEVIFEPPLLEDDSPEMRSLKEAIIAKQIDINKYEHRFGDKFNNDKRLFKKSDITLAKLRSISRALDIRATLILEDLNPDIANPMGKSIIVDITSPENQLNEEED